MLARIIILKFYLILLIPFTVLAEEHWYNYDHLNFQAGTYFHFDSSEYFSGSKFFTSLEAVKSNDWLYGLSLFENSFSQFCQYLYAGKSWNYHGKLEGFHTKLTAGFIHGYKDEFKATIPFNSLGIGPAIIPGIGYKKGRFSGDMIMLEFSALLFTVGVDF